MIAIEALWKWGCKLQRLLFQNLYIVVEKSDAFLEEADSFPQKKLPEKYTRLNAHDSWIQSFAFGHLLRNTRSYRSLLAIVW